ncbi:MAG: metalloregulator ArsR/SmtB family transcription factor [Bacillota bacterium]|nr:metalloregulator ArsR/SmtB family transcription factor [Bacillota bacterium]
MPELIGILKALSDQTRFNLVNLLVNHDYCVGALANRLDISESAVSQHLKVLRNAGIVKGEKRGYFTHYWVDRESLKDAAKEIIELSSAIPVVNKCNNHTIIHPKHIHVAERRETKMSKGNCEHPDLKIKDCKCSEKQIKECYGDETNHSCDCEEKK